jgi:hypothetical protein
MKTEGIKKQTLLNRYPVYDLSQSDVDVKEDTTDFNSLASAFAINKG